MPPLLTALISPASLLWSPEPADDPDTGVANIIIGATDVPNCIADGATGGVVVFNGVANRTYDATVGSAVPVVVVGGSIAAADVPTDSDLTSSSMMALRSSRGSARNARQAKDKPIFPYEKPKHNGSR